MRAVSSSKRLGCFETEGTAGTEYAGQLLRLEDAGRLRSEVLAVVVEVAEEVVAEERRGSEKVEVVVGGRTDLE